MDGISCTTFESSSFSTPTSNWKRARNPIRPLTNQRHPGFLCGPSPDKLAFWLLRAPNYRTSLGSTRPLPLIIPRRRRRLAKQSYRYAYYARRISHLRRRESLRSSTLRLSPRLIRNYARVGTFTACIRDAHLPTCVGMAEDVYFLCGRGGGGAGLLGRSRFALCERADFREAFAN